jgi:hypothetical protein
MADTVSSSVAALSALSLHRAISKVAPRQHLQCRQGVADGADTAAGNRRSGSRSAVIQSEHGAGLVDRHHDAADSFDEQHILVDQ